MAARGSIVKAEILEKIKESFPSMFSPDGKEWRIPMKENGENIEIKISLTAAKDILGEGSNILTPPENSGFPVPVEQKASPIPTEQEQKNIATLLSAIGL